MPTIENLQTQIIRLRATCSAYEHLLIAVFDTHPEKNAIREAFEKSAQTTHGLLLFESDFNDEEIEANQIALEKLSRLLTIGDAEP